MAYVIRTVTQDLGDKHFYSSDHLYEMTRAELRKAINTETMPSAEYNIIPASLAHRYVRQGMTHSTALYIDDMGRIRRAA